MNKKIVMYFIIIKGAFGAAAVSLTYSFREKR
jgi:hypothetical protein